MDRAVPISDRFYVFFYVSEYAHLPKGKGKQNDKPQSGKSVKHLVKYIIYPLKQLVPKATFPQ